jgi:hypothetical protein
MSAESNGGRRRRGPDKDRWKRARRQRERDKQRQPIPGQRVFAWFTEDPQPVKEGGADGSH